jgi:hypothetical protein
MQSQYSSIEICSSLGTNVLIHLQISVGDYNDFAFLLLC